MALYSLKNRIASKRIYEGEIINLRVDNLKLPTGQAAKREVVEHNGGVVIACQPTPERIVLIRQYRYALDREIIELPAGRIEKNEDPLLAAQRELTEETGYVARDWSELSRMYTAPGFCDEILYMFRARDVHLTQRNLDEDEEIELLEITLQEAWRMAVKGEIVDAKTVAGLGLLIAENL